MKQIKGLEKAPLYDDQGRLLAVNGQQLPRPADNTDQALSYMIARQSGYRPIRKIQTNHMDEAYNHMLQVQPKRTQAMTTEERVKQQQINEAMKQILVQYYAGGM